MAELMLLMGDVDAARTRAKCWRLILVSSGSLSMAKRAA